MKRPDFDPAAVESIEWRPPAARSVRVTSAGRRETVRLDHLPRPDRLALIRVLRASVPADRQVGWPDFCWRVASPLRRSIEPVLPLRPGERLLTRRRIDGLFAVGAAAVAVTAAGVSAYVGHDRSWAVLGLIAVLWAVCRFSHPKAGVPVVAADLAPPGHRAWTTAFVASFPLGLAAAVAAGRFFDRGTAASVAAAVLFPVAAFLPLAIVDRRYAAARKAWRERRRAESVAAWDRRERPAAPPD